MKKIVLAIATVLFASGMAFAGSDHFGSDDGFGTANAGHHAMVFDNSVDMTATKSIGTADSAPAQGENADIPAGYGQGIWGR